MTDYPLPTVAEDWVFEDDLPEWLGPACSYIEANGESLPCVHEIAAAVRVSPQRLIAGFLRYLGFTPDEFVADLTRRHDPTEPSQH